ncbi:MAG: S8 family serine peptidase [Flavobacteriales bacterium]|nr:S8 family serine peptidase [Flavobacteriales bacterium]MBP6698159.1 S8 family serine peptidase [Flavobacteriales bacterium]
MKTVALVLLVAFAIAQPIAALAQKDKTYIRANTNDEALQRLAKEDSSRYWIAHVEALRIAREKGWPIEGLQYIGEDGRPLYYSTSNDAAAGLTQTIALRNNMGVQGLNMWMGEWDENHARSTHQDLVGRLFYGDAQSPLGDHATHVAGTLIGSPPGATTSRGMAPQASLFQFNWDNDQAEMAASAGSPLNLLVSNHSYGIDYGYRWTDNLWQWNGGAAQFVAGGDDPGQGRYDDIARATDLTCASAPFYLPVVAAGNDNTSNPSSGSTVRDGSSGTPVSWNPALHPAGDGTQRCNISDRAIAKNALTVGNLQANSTINPSSSRGMTDDGRVKPDICGKGTDLYSAVSSSNSAYDTYTGTSMASPNVAGSLLLMQEAYEKRNGNVGLFMRSATLKGLAIHTAADLGNPGPDVTYGWGLLNASECGRVINEDVAWNGVQTSRILEFPGNTGYVYSFNTTGAFRVTLCYTDVAGTNTSVHNDPTAKLVNDLDLRVIGPGGVTYFPFVLDTANPDANAVHGDNDKDNVEMVYRSGIPAGTYDVYVNAEGSVSGGLQPYSLLINGQNNACNFFVNHGPNNIVPGTYNAQGAIGSQGIVPAGSAVTYQAGVAVSLKPGFKAASGTSFIGRIQSCN